MTRLFIVDDDQSVLEFVSEALNGADYEVITFQNSKDLLERTMDDEPDIILSDVSMPDVDGFELKEAYSLKYPHRMTPFVFISSHSDSEHMIKGLSMGADDYLIKPLDAELLKVKITSTLKNKLKYSTPVFYGDMTKFPFVRLLQFCELKGLTGEVDITSADINTRLRFRGGNLLTEEIDDNVLEQLYDRNEGTFVIYSRPFEFKDIEDAAVERAAEAVKLTENNKPLGKLSGVRVKDKLFQLQTEFNTYPSNQIATIVVLGGKVVTKRLSDVTDGSLTRSDIEKLIEKQHIAVESQIRDKVSEFIKKKASGEESAKEKFNRLFEAGFDAYREGDYEGAMMAWKEAYHINPTDKTLETNLRILQKKLGQD